MPLAKPMKPMKKKRVLSEAHKEKLNGARVKALEVRRANATAKKELKELEKKAKQKKVDDLKKYIGEDVPVPVKEVVKEVKTTPTTPTTPATPNFSTHMHLAPDKQKYLTAEDVEEISIQAIAGYEKIRKGRKALKKEENETKQAQEEVRELLRKTIQPRNITYGQEGYFNDCF